MLRCILSPFFVTMYDNLDLTVPKELCPNTNFIEETPQYLTKVITEGVSEFGRYLIGYLDNAKIKITDRKVSFVESSICKFALGDNFKTLSRNGTRLAIEQLSDSLHLPFDESNVYRIDLAQNLILNHEEDVYLKHLGDCRYYTRLEQENGLYYNSNKKQLLFYGKVHEQKVKGNPIPDLYKDESVLRYEMRLRKRLLQVLNRPSLMAKDLFDASFYPELLKMWYNEFKNIQKMEARLSIEPTGSTKDFVESLATFTLAQMGQTKAIEKIHEWQVLNQISKKQAYDLRKTVKKLCSVNRSKDRNDLIIELDKKIFEASISW